MPTYVYKGLGFFESDEVQDAVALLRYLADPLSFPRGRLPAIAAGQVLDCAIAVLSPGGLAEAIAGDEPSWAAAL